MRIFVGTAALGALACIALFLIRLASAVSFSEPLQVHTTGDEFTNYFNIWKQIQGIAVYNDRFEVPYSGAIYNWLFYWSYAIVGGGILKALSLGDAWLPTVMRFLTLAGIALGTAASYFTFIRASRAEDSGAKLIALAFAVFLMLGPLLGFWSMTVRADIWALTLEIIGAGLFLAYYPRRSIAAVLMLVVAVYLAWSFKQGSVFTAGGAGLLLLARRDWKPFFILVTVLPAAWALTFAVGDPMWSKYILLKDFPFFYFTERMLRNIANFGVKSGPTLLFLAALVIALWRSRELKLALWKNDTVIFALGAAFCALILSVPFSAQHGGAENYFFTLSFFLILIVMGSLPELHLLNAPRRRMVLLSGVAGWGSLILAVMVVLAGVVGVTDVRPQHKNYTSLKKCADALPRPLYFANNYMGLPWMTPGNIPFVLSYIYQEERALGKKFQHDGVGGLVAKGAFASVVTMGGATPPTQIDGGSLEGYATVTLPECEGLHVFQRRSSVTPFTLDNWPND